MSDNVTPFRSRSERDAKEDALAALRDTRDELESIRRSWKPFVLPDDARDN